MGHQTTCPLPFVSMLTQHVKVNIRDKSPPAPLWGGRRKGVLGSTRMTNGDGLGRLLSCKSSLETGASLSPVIVQVRQVHLAGLCPIAPSKGPQGGFPNRPPVQIVTPSSQRAIPAEFQEGDPLCVISAPPPRLHEIPHKRSPSGLDCNYNSSRSSPERDRNPKRLLQEGARSKHGILHRSKVK